MASDPAAIISASGIAIAAVGGAIAAVLGSINRHTISHVEKTTEAIHVLSNSAMAAQLKLNVDFAKSDAVTKHRIAVLTKEEGDTAAASAADVQVLAQEAILQAHLAAQSKVDAEAIKGK